MFKLTLVCALILGAFGFTHDTTWVGGAVSLQTSLLINKVIEWSAEGVTAGTDAAPSADQIEWAGEAEKRIGVADLTSAIDTTSVAGGCYWFTNEIVVTIGQTITLAVFGDALTTAVAAIDKTQIATNLFVATVGCYLQTNALVEGSADTSNNGFNAWVGMGIEDGSTDALAMSNIAGGIAGLIVDD